MSPHNARLLPVKLLSKLHSYNSGYTMTRLKELKDIAVELRGSQIRGLAVESIRRLAIELIKDVLFPCVKYNEEKTFLRSRICLGGHPFDSLLDLIYPATPSKTFGRASVPGATVLYGSFNKGTAMDEIGVSTGDVVQTILFRPREANKIELIAVGEIQASAANGRTRVASDELVQDIGELMKTDPAKFHEVLFVDSFLAEIFARECHYSYDYAISAVFAELMFDSCNIGVLYPSMRRDQGWNLALPGMLFDTHCEVVAVHTERIRSVYGYGIYEPDISELRYSHTFNRDGQIVWEQRGFPNVEWSLKSGTKFSPSHNGWRHTDGRDV